MDESTTTMTLTDFLLARIAEDEATARSVTWGHPLGAPPLLMTHGTLHIDPARVLAECEAKRRIVGLHTMSPVYTEDSGETFGDGCSCGYPAICPTLRALALPYADHPDYREEWV